MPIINMLSFKYRRRSILYTVEFYEDVNGNSEVRDYIEQLAQRSITDKNARINKNKIFKTIIKILFIIFNPIKLPLLKLLLRK